MKKRLVLKDSVKSFLAISFLFLVVIVGSIALGTRLNNLSEQKKIDTQMYINQ